jgi:hypothetical protein
MGMPNARVSSGYRPMPRDFIETFLRVGWDSIEAEMHAHKTTIVRWIEAYDIAAIEEGRPILRELRRMYLIERNGLKGWGVSGRIKPSRASRYVMGRTLAAEQNQRR